MNADTSIKKNEQGLNLSLKERIEIIRSNRYFLMVFPFVMLALIILVFSIATQGNFFRPSVLKGVFSQAIIIGTCATGVAFIYSNGNLDISIGAVLGMAATLGVLTYNATQSALLFVLVSMGSALVLMTFNCTMRRCYAASVEVVDQWVGKLLDTLERRGLWENTVVIFCADHGEMLGDHGLLEKTVMYEASVRIPLIISAPWMEGRQDTNALAQLMDLAPTCLELAGVGWNKKDMGRGMRRQSDYAGERATGRFAHHPAALSACPFLHG